MMSSTSVTKQIHRVNLHAFLSQQDGKFVGVDFVKQNGKNRALNGRLGVTKFSKGGPNKVEAADRPYLTIYDAKSEGYRTLNLATVSKVRAESAVFEVVD